MKVIRKTKISWIWSLACNAVASALAGVHDVQLDVYSCIAPIYMCA